MNTQVLLAASTTSPSLLRPLAAPFSFSMTSPGCARTILGPHLGHEGEDTGHAQGEDYARARTHTHTSDMRVETLAMQ